MLRTYVYATHAAYIADISVPNVRLANQLPLFIRRKYCRKPKHTIIRYLDFKNLNNNDLLHNLQNDLYRILHLKQMKNCRNGVK